LRTFACRGTVLRYLAYDLIAKEAKEQIDLPFKSRMKMIQEEVDKPRKRLNDYR
jgi:hypothetical protein